MRGRSDELRETHWAVLTTPRTPQRW
eukprot:COSAG01_NODE_65820_length_272_cov_0.595376_1_plen_25_part_01